MTHNRMYDRNHHTMVYRRWICPAEMSLYRLTADDDSPIHHYKITTTHTHFMTHTLKYVRSQSSYNDVYRRGICPAEMSLYRLTADDSPPDSPS